MAAMLLLAGCQKEASVPAEPVTPANPNVNPKVTVMQVSPAGEDTKTAIEDNNDGTLTATPTYTPGDKTITNTYTASGEVQLQAVKALSGHAWPNGGKVTFTELGGGTLNADNSVTIASLAVEGAVTLKAEYEVTQDILREDRDGGRVSSKIYQSTAGTLLGLCQYAVGQGQRSQIHLSDIDASSLEALVQVLVERIAFQDIQEIAF